MAEKQGMIASNNTCTGCSACVSVCERKAISYQIDNEGFKIPQVDEEKCILCGKCSYVCPSLFKRRQTDYEMKAYAAFSIDEDARSNSASGAFFIEAAKKILNMGGWVCGCILDDDRKVKHIISKKYVDICRMQDSKYVQSDMGDCFFEIKKLLRNYPVLFSGTSCQVDGLKKYLDMEKIDTAKLITIDFICHGVPSPMIWDEFIHFYETKKDRLFLGYRFRPKKYGWGNKARGGCLLGMCKSKKKSFFGRKSIVWDDKSVEATMWRHIFFSNLVLRKCCHVCKYASLDKPADITMGDFWGIDDFMPNFNDGKGCSCVTTRGEKGNDFFLSLNNLQYRRTRLEYIKHKQENLQNPSQPSILRKQFWDDYYNNGFEYVAKRYFYYEKLLWKKIRRVLFRLHLSRI